MAITGQEQSNSPDVDQGLNSKVYTRTFVYDRSYNWAAEMPTVGDFDATYGYFQGYRATPGVGYTTVVLRYDTAGVQVNFNPGDSDTEYWAETVGEEKPVEYHPSYIVRWNWGLYGKRTGGAAFTTADYPGGDAAYLIATDINVLAANEKLSWFKTHPGIAWDLIKKPTKAFDFYIDPVRQVFKRAYHRQQSSAESALVAVGKLVVPAEVFGATPSTTANWLVMSSNTQYDGRYWVAETAYKHSPQGWDSDIYSVP